MKLATRNSCPPRSMGTTLLITGDLAPVVRDEYAFFEINGPVFAGG